MVAAVIIGGKVSHTCVWFCLANSIPFRIGSSQFCPESFPGFWGQRLKLVPQIVGVEKDPDVPGIARGKQRW